MEELETAFSIEKPAGRKRWILALLLTLLLHWAVFQLDLPKFGSALPPTPLDVKTINPKKLEAIRRQWKAKNLLLNRNKTASVEPAPNARYLSDRNIRVEKEQRARETAIIPKKSVQRAQSSEQKSSRSSVHDLARLGLPFRSNSHLPEAPASHVESEGGDQAIFDRNLPQGSENLLNAQESVFYSFYARVYETIGPLWQSLIRGTPYQHSIREGEYTTSVDVVFDSEGNLLAVRELRNSGIPEFDSAVQKAWYQAKRFPNPPKDLLDSKQEVHTGWTFTVVVNEGFRMNYLPPERNY